MVWQGKRHEQPFRLKAYKEALAAIGEPYREEWVFERSLTITDGQNCSPNGKGWRRSRRLFCRKRPSISRYFLEAQRHQVDIPGSLAI
ncbi:hypothetical protein PO124_06830 [Bacillus licheniformis]|nr:hypothetical protein [Bacillus licheniformis]